MQIQLILYTVSIPSRFLERGSRACQSCAMACGFGHYSCHMTKYQAGEEIFINRRKRYDAIKIVENVRTQTMIGRVQNVSNLISQTYPPRSR